MISLYKKFLTYVPERNLYVFISIGCSTIYGILVGVSYYFIYKFFYQILVLKNLEQAKNCSITVFFIIIIAELIYFIGVCSAHLVGFRLETALRNKGISGVINSSFKFFDTHSSGATRKIIDDNAAETHMMIAHLIPDNTAAIIIPISLIIIAFLVNIRVGLSIFVLILVNVFILKKFTQEREFMKMYQESLEKMGNETVEYIRGIQVIKIFKTNIFSFKNLYNAIKNYSEMAYAYSISCKAWYNIFQLLFLGISCIVIPIFLIFFKSDFSTTNNVLNLIMIMFLSGALFVAFMRIMYVSMHFSIAQNTLNKLDEIFEETQKDKLEFGTATLMDNYNIEFENVCFGYTEKMILNNLSFKLDENKIYAFVGASGSGKSTIAKLISGFYKLNSGKIKIGNKDLKDYTEETIMKNISFVFQNARLFKDTIYNNVLIAKPDSSYEKVMSALKNANCLDILEKFPNRENTIIGSKGVYLSGGEKQRIAIARSILKNSPIIIMDEASASIDADNEHELQKAFKYLMKNKTVIMIAHRLTSIINVDEVIVIENGEIIERGTHRELMNKDSNYKKIQNLYAQSNDWRLSYE